MPILSQRHFIQAYIDGACIPKNPGGVPVWGFLLLKDNAPINTKGGLAGAEFSAEATNNVAEYEAFINALKEINQLGWNQDNVVVYTDSQILYKQLTDEWKANSQLLRWYNRAKAVMARFSSIELRKIPRDQNRVAHRAAKAAYYEARLAHSV